MALGFYLLGACAEGYHLVVFYTVILMMIICASALLMCEIKAVTKDEKQDDDQIEEPNKVYAWLAIIGFFVAFFIYSEQRLAYPEYLKQYFSTQAYSVILALNPLFIIFLQRFVISKFSVKNKVLANSLGVFILGCSFLLLYTNSWLPLIVTACFVYSVGEMFISTYSMYVCYNFSSEKNRALNLSMYRIFGALGGLLGAPLAGEIISIKNIDYVWLQCFILGLAFFIVTVTILKKSKHTSIC